ncbi:hypothetical protein [Flavobacterium sp.]|uniref:hypothetical protein n=1 Tax=Flavobacterium sp. TaxID=239 RepID=UPI0032663158
MSGHLCACGCGQETNVVPYNVGRSGYQKGDHYRYVRDHFNNHADRVLRRFPFDPADVGPTTKALARRLGIDTRPIYRWRTQGVTVRRAEWLADRLGCHPTELWPDYYEVCS